MMKNMRHWINAISINEARQTRVERLIAAAEHLNRYPVRLALFAEDEDDVSIQKIDVVSDHRGMGYASDSMKELCKLADKYKVNLYLEAYPDEDEEDMDVERLVMFYKRFGFEGGTGQERMMWRLPKSSKNRK